MPEADIRENREKNVNRIIAGLLARQIQVIIIGQLKLYAGPAPGAVKCGSIFQNNEDYLQLDDMHLTPAGQHRVAMELVPCVERLIGKK